MRSYAQQAADAQTVIQAHLTNPDMTLLELSEMVGYENNNFAHRILSYYYEATKHVQDARVREEERRKAHERAMAFAARKEAYRLLKLPLRNKRVEHVESKATRDEDV